MKRVFLILGLFFLSFAGCSNHENGVELISTGDRVKATEIQARFLNIPNNINLGQVQGKVVVIDFWATWCGPCREEISTLEKMFEFYHSKGLEVWGLSVEANDDQPDGFFNQFISDNQIHYPIGLASSETLKAYGVSPIPATFFIDKSGKIALSFVGVHPEKDFSTAIEKLLAE